MRRLLLSGILFLVSYGFSNSQVLLGVGGGYATTQERFALDLDFKVMVKDNQAVTFDFIYVWPVTRTEQGFELTTFSFMFDLNYSYYLTPEELFKIYPFGGLNFTNLKSDVLITDPVTTTFRETNSKLGLNLGLGIEFGKDDFVPFVEGKYIVSELEQWIALVGFRLKF